MRIHSLDYIRVIATLMIFIFHFNQQTGFHNIDTNIFIIQNFINDSIGSLGISIFIILSGSSIYASYSNKKFIFSDYFSRRILSIFPLYYICWFFIFTLLWLFYGHAPRNETLSTFVFTLLGFDGFLYYLVPNYYLVGEWFLGFIIILYFLVPILLKNIELSFILSVILMFFCIQNYSLISSMEMLHYPLIRLPEFIFGMLIIKYRRIVDARLSVFVMLLIFAAVYNFRLTVLSDFDYMYTRVIVGTITFTFLFQLFNIICVFKVNMNRLICFISGLSFSFFLLHHNIIAIMLTPFDNQSMNQNFALIIIAIIIFISWIINIFVNKKIVPKLIAISG